MQYLQGLDPAPCLRAVFVGSLLPLCRNDLQRLGYEVFNIAARANFGFPRSNKCLIVF